MKSERRRCILKACKNKNVHTSSTLSYHGLPRKEDIRKQWLLWVASAMNKLIDKGMGCKLVFYGTLNKSPEVDLLRHTQDVDMKRLETVQGIMAKIKAADGSTTPTKSANSDLDNDTSLNRANSDLVTESPTKVPRMTP